MTDSIAASSVSIVEIGPAARVALREGSQGAVLAVFRRSFYVSMTGRGDGKDVGPGLACIGSLPLESGPLNALSDPQPDSAWPTPDAVGEPARVEGGVLTFGRHGFRLDTARLWEPARLPAVTRSQRAAGLALLRGVCSETVPARGLGALLLPTVDGAPLSPLEAALHRSVCAALEQLREWTAFADRQAAPSAWPEADGLVGLLGLGGGLTPAGDDFLGGAFIALRALGMHAVVERLSRPLLDAAPARTGSISVAHLAAAAAGLGAAPLMAVLDALGRLCRTNLEEALRRLDAIGHTSGWDALAGVASVWGADVSPRQTVVPEAARDRYRLDAERRPASEPEARPC